MTVIEAIAKQEGFGVPGAIPTICHNPGDLIYGPEAVHFGAIAAHGRFAVFPDDETGWHALRKWLSMPAQFDKNGQLTHGYLGAILQQVIDRFAPPVENDSVGYLDFVMKATGLSADTILTLEVLG